MKAMQVFDANHSSHLPLPMLVTPYAVQRFLVNINVTLTNAASNSYLIIMPNGYAGSTQGSVVGINSTVAISGSATTAVNAATIYTAPDLNALANTVAAGYQAPEVAFSAASVNLLCTSNQQSSSGSVWIGRSQAPIENWGSVSTNFDSQFGAITVRQDIKPLSFFELYKAHNILALPMDFVSYETFTPLVPQALLQTNATAVNALTPIILCFGPGNANYNVRVAFEGRVRYPISDSRYTLHQRHTPTPQGTFNGLVGQAERVIGGVFRDGEEAAERVVRGVVGAGMRRATRGVLG